jgi:hypothetical protein
MCTFGRRGTIVERRTGNDEDFGCQRMVEGGEGSFEFQDSGFHYTLFSVFGHHSFQRPFLDIIGIEDICAGFGQSPAHDISEIERYWPDPARPTPGWDGYSIDLGNSAGDGFFLIEQRKMYLPE